MSDDEMLLPFWKQFREELFHSVQFSLLGEFDVEELDWPLRTDFFMLVQKVFSPD